MLNFCGAAGVPPSEILTLPIPAFCNCVCHCFISYWYSQVKFKAMQVKTFEDFLPGLSGQTDGHWITICNEILQWELMLNRYSAELRGEIGTKNKPGLCLSQYNYTLIICGFTTFCCLSWSTSPTKMSVDHWVKLL